MKGWSSLENFRIVKAINSRTAYAKDFIYFDDFCHEVHLDSRAFEEVKERVLDMLTNKSYMVGYSAMKRANYVYLFQVPVPEEFANWLHSKGDIELDNFRRLTTFKPFEGGKRIGFVNPNFLNSKEDMKKTMLYFLAHLAKTETATLSDWQFAMQYNKWKDNAFDVSRLVPIFEECKKHIFKFPVMLATQAVMAFITQVKVPTLTLHKFRGYSNRMEVDFNGKITMFMSKNRLYHCQRKVEVVRSEEKEVKMEEPETTLLEPKKEVLDVKPVLTQGFKWAPSRNSAPGHINYIKFLEVIDQGMEMFDFFGNLMTDIGKEINKTEDDQVIEAKRIKTSFEFALTKLNKFKTTSNENTENLTAILIFFSDIIQSLEMSQLESIFQQIGELEKAIEGYNVPITVVQQVMEYVMLACRPAK